MTAFTRGSSITPRHLVAPISRVWNTSGGKPARAHDVFDGQRALRHVGGVLEQAHVARHQRRRDETEDLPERKIPGHHGEHRADGLVADEALRAAGIHRLVGQQALGVLGVVAAGGGALGGLLARGLQRLAHFERHDARECVLLRFQDFRGAPHPSRRARRTWCGDRCGRRAAARASFSSSWDSVSGVERDQAITRGGVYGGDHYSLFSDSRRATRSPPAR